MGILWGNCRLQKPLFFFVPTSCLLLMLLFACHGNSIMGVAAKYEITKPSVIRNALFGYLIIHFLVASIFSVSLPSHGMYNCNGRCTVQD